MTHLREDGFRDVVEALAVEQVGRDLAGGRLAGADAGAEPWAAELAGVALGVVVGEGLLVERLEDGLLENGRGYSVISYDVDA